MNPTASLDSFQLPQSTTACHQQHQHWQHLIRQQEEEIQQLRALLLEVMNLYNHHSLRHSLQHDAIDYCRDLNHLQTKLDRLRRDLICEGVTCSLTSGNGSCADARFNPNGHPERHAAALVGEFSSIKDGCLQFLSGMVSLNLL